MKVKIIKSPVAKSGASITPLSGDTMQFNGNSHSDGGIPISYGGKQVEVEGGETGYKADDGSLNIMGNMTNPLTNRKFKEDSKRIAEKERRIDKLVGYSTDLINKADPTDKWDNLKFNAGKVMLTGGLQKKKELSDNKEWLATLQKVMLQHADEMGVDAQDFSKGKLTKAKNGARIAQSGYTLPSDSPLGNANIDKSFREAFIKMMAEAPDFVQKGVSVGSGWRDMAEQKRLYASGLEKYGAKGVKTRVATPGGSAHQYGLASDLQFSDPKAKEWIYANANKYGMSFPLPKDDPNHMIYSAGMKGGTWKGKSSILNYGPEDQSTYTPSTEDLVKFPNMKFNPNTIQYPKVGEQRVAPKDYDLGLSPTTPYNKPSNATKFGLNQILPELYTAATNKVEPVNLQRYDPQLYQPYNVSFQDRLNQNESSFNALTKANAHNPAAQSVLAGQKYEADNQVLAEQFRTNQGIEQDIVNKNVSLLNDAQARNLSLADTQYVRQAQTKSKVKEQNAVVLDSISEKLREHQLENRTLQIYENLYPNYSFDEKNNMKRTYSGPNGDEWINWGEVAGNPGNDNTATVKKYDPNGNLQYTKLSQTSAMKYQLDQSTLMKNSLDIFKQKRDLYAQPIQRQSKYKPKKSLIGLNY